MVNSKQASACVISLLASIIKQLLEFSYYALNLMPSFFQVFVCDTFLPSFLYPTDLISVGSSFRVAFSNSVHILLLICRRAPGHILRQLEDKEKKKIYNKTFT
ncbi:hypothetical protein D910_05611 [Dendroctonus ponderosae]|uniref:Uncharacterized protein n=1 Tax=Dendroctonus ponderosae TaxID=77166 RepID=U4U7A1_DENPD|nr:hypothetical protein D910_05611 [Dendroctonus ponderosae]